MAIRERGDRRLRWQVYWQNPNTKKRESKSFATEFEAQKYDSLVKHRLLYEPESFETEKGSPEEETLPNTLEAAFYLYVKDKQFSKHQIVLNIAAFQLALKMYGTSDINTIGKDEFKQLQAVYRSTGLKDTTIYFRLSRLKTLLLWSIDHDIRTEPLPNIKLQGGSYEKFIPPTKEEIEQILAAANSMLQRIIVVSAYFGVRVGASELLQLTWEDVDFNKKVLRVHGSKKNKAAPWRDVPIRDNLLPILESWFTEDLNLEGNYIIHKKDGSRHEPYFLRYHWRQALKKAGIIRRIRLYDLRHYFGTELVEAGIDIGTIAKLMGHSNPTMLLSHYQYVKDKQKKAAIESLPELKFVPKAMCPKMSDAKKPTL